MTVTVDAGLVKAAEAAVRAGRADSVSAWVNLALTERADEERRFEAMAEAVAAFESEHGTITDQEIAEQRRADRRNAVVVPTPRRRKRKNAA